MAAQLAGCQQTLDVFHALEHVARAGHELYGEPTPEAAAFLERGRMLLLEKGWNRITELTGQELSQSDTPQRRKPLEKMLGYFSKHTVSGKYLWRDGWVDCTTWASV